MVIKNAENAIMSTNERLSPFSVFVRYEWVFSVMCVCVCASISWRKKKPHARSNREKKTECAWHRTFFLISLPSISLIRWVFKSRMSKGSIHLFKLAFVVWHWFIGRERCSQFEDIDSPTTATTMTMMLLDYAWEIMRPVTSRAATYLMW